MTKEEKMTDLIQMYSYFAQFSNEKSKCHCEALQMAIEALQQKTGHWIPWKAYYGEDRKSWSDELKCSECGYKWGDEEYKFCPSCVCRMVGEEE